jgi:hypothetical protein
MAGCACRFDHHDDGAVTFVHDGLGRIDRFEISAPDVRNLDLDLWGAQVKPWIERLHQETDYDAAPGVDTFASPFGGDDATT